MLVALMSIERDIVHVPRGLERVGVVLLTQCGVRHEMDIREIRFKLIGR